MPGRNAATPNPTPAVQHIPATAAPSGESAAQAASSGARATQATAVHESGGKAVANRSPEAVASPTGASVPTAIPRRVRSSTYRGLSGAKLPAAAAGITRSLTVTADSTDERGKESPPIR